MTPSLFADLESYLRARFPESDLARTDSWPIHHHVHIRFELGEPFENGTDERIAQVRERSTSIIRDCFSPQDDVLLLITDWGPDAMFGDPTPRHLYELIGEALLGRAQQRQLAISDDDGQGEVGERVVQQLIVPASFEALPCEAILAGIANHEQGREPGIGQAVFFIAQQRDVVFHMYDDRGCIVFSDAPSKLEHLYVKYSAWIVEYWRDTIDDVFGRGR